MWIIIIKSILALVSIFTGGAIFYKYIKDNKILVFLAGSVSILSAVYLFSEIRRDIDKFLVEKKVESKVEQNKEETVEVKKVEPKITFKWFSPTDKSVTWKRAKQICRDNGGRLPTIEELKEVVTDCGGINTTFGDKDWNSITDKNSANKSYQACYKRKGFSYDDFWSSSTVVGYEYHAWFVNFYNGDDNWYDKSNSYYVRCVRGGQ